MAKKTLSKRQLSRLLKKQKGKRFVDHLWREHQRRFPPPGGVPQDNHSSDSDASKSPYSGHSASEEDLAGWYEDRSSDSSTPYYSSSEEEIGHKRPKREKDRRCRKVLSRPSGSILRYKDPSVALLNVPNVEKSLWFIYYPGKLLSEEHPLQRTQVLLSPIWEPKLYPHVPDRPEWFPFSYDMYKAAISKIENPGSRCSFLHVLLNPHRNLSGKMVDFACGCSDWKLINWVTMYLIGQFFPQLHFRIRVAFHAACRDGNTYDCVLVQEPNDEVSQLDAEIYLIRTRNLPPQQPPVPKLKKKRGRSNFGSNKDRNCRRELRLRNQLCANYWKGGHITSLH